jgi:hypothetical protein
MLSAWEAHVRAIQDWISDSVILKYTAGQREHGGALWRKNTWPHIKQEIVDLVIYSQTHDMQIQQAIKLLELAYDTHNINLKDDYLESALHVLQYGNEDGEEEEELSPSEVEV